MKTRNTPLLTSRVALTAMLFTLAAPLSSAFAQGTAFTYQGRLNAGGNVANGSYDLRFAVCDAASGGNVVSGVVTNSATSVTNGLFVVTLDFGSGILTGANRWLEIAVRTNGGGGFATLTPRQALTPSPYAITANSASNLLGVIPASQLGGTLPSAQLAGVYSNGLTLNNGANVFDGTFYGNFLGLSFIGGSFSGQFVGDGGSLINLNASQLTAGTIPTTRLAPNVALLNVSNPSPASSKPPIPATPSPASLPATARASQT